MMLHRIAGFVLGIFALMSSEALSAAPTLLHDYELNGNYLDAEGGEPIMPEGGTITATYQQLNPTRPTTDDLDNYNNGLTLNSPGLSDPGVYTIYMRVMLQELRSETNTGYIKLLDFKNAGYDDLAPGQGYTNNVYYDNGLYSYQPGTSGSTSYLEFYGNGGKSAAPVIVQNQWFDLIVTRTADGMFSAYDGGSLLFSFDDSVQQNAVFDQGNNTMRFYQDDLFTLDPNPANPHRADYEFGDGRIDFIRIYDGAMDAQQVASLVPVKGDVNGDGVFNMADVSAFAKELANPTDQGNLLAVADFDGDSVITNADLQGMLDALKDGGTSMAAVPEPSGLLMLGAGALGMLLLGRKQPQWRAN